MPWVKCVVVLVGRCCRDLGHKRHKILKNVDRREFAAALTRRLPERLTRHRIRFDFNTRDRHGTYIHFP